MMSNTFILPSYFDTPLATEILGSRYDSKGRQLGFVETEVQRSERMAIVNASKSRTSSPTQPSSSTETKLIAKPHDSIESMANPLAKEYLNSSDDFLSLSDEILHSTSKSSFVSTSRKSSSRSSNPGYTRHSLSSIREEECLNDETHLFKRQYEEINPTLPLPYSSDN